MGQAVSSDYQELYQYQLPYPKPINTTNLEIATLRKLKMIAFFHFDNFEQIDHEHFKKIDLTEQHQGIYYGEIANNKRQGLAVTDYNVDEQVLESNIQYFGEFANDKQEGTGLAIFDDDSWYFGSWNKGNAERNNHKTEYSDFGVFKKVTGEIYQGEWMNRRLKFGQYISDNEFYQGSFDENGKYHGFGKLRYLNGWVYVGSFYHGYCQGEGIVWYDAKSIYVGQFHRHYKHGIGKLIIENKTEYYGHFSNDKYHGLGRLRQQDRILEGRFENGLLVGLYSECDANNNFLQWKIINKPYYYDEKYVEIQNSSNASQSNQKSNIKIKDKTHYLDNLSEELDYQVQKIPFLQVYQEEMDKKFNFDAQIVETVDNMQANLLKMFEEEVDQKQQAYEQKRDNIEKLMTKWQELERLQEFLEQQKTSSQLQQ